MMTEPHDATHPAADADMEAFRERVAESRRWLALLPVPPPGPSLLRRTAGGDSVEVLALNIAVVIGRHAPAPWGFPEDKDLSREHFRILVAGDVCFAEDLHSSNGLYINGRRVERRCLVHGDHLRAGKQDFVFHAGGE